ncbi:MAG: hypothetical protein JST54_15635 [Deltaproteobacteria bacterium]|nr:hypothetical protein [Deltaproteobacteria bacterium]
MAKALARLGAGMALLLAGIARAQTAAPPNDQAASDPAQPAVQEPAPPPPTDQQSTPPEQQPTEQAQPLTPEQQTAHAQELEAQVKSQQDQIQQLQQQLDAQNQTNAQLNEANDQLSQANGQLGQVVDQMQGLNDQVAQGQANVEAREAARSQSAEQLARVMDNLRTAEYVLSFGSTDGVDQALGDASQFLTGQAADEVYAAQVSLANDDLFAARGYIVQAIAVGVANQVGGTNQSIATPTP